jgi:hypothetical protein
MSTPDKIRATIRAMMAAQNVSRSAAMGSHAQASLYHVLGLRYGFSDFEAGLLAASDEQLARMSEICKPYAWYLGAELSREQQLEAALKDFFEAAMRGSEDTTAIHPCMDLTLKHRDVLRSIGVR